MAKHYKIVITVAYDEATVPYDMQLQLEENVDRCLSRNGLLNDAQGKAIIEDICIEVEEKR